MTVQHMPCAGLLARSAPVAHAQGIGLGPEMQLGVEAARVFAQRNADGFATTTVRTHGGFEAFSAAIARGGFGMPSELAQVAAVAAIPESGIIGTGLAQPEVHHA